jgi:hypothetical protein
MIYLFPLIIEYLLTLRYRYHVKLRFFLRKILIIVAQVQLDPEVREGVIAKMPDKVGVGAT